MLRLAAGQAPDHRGAHLGVGVDPDDDPAHGAHDAVDGALRVDSEGVRRDPPALPDARASRRCVMGGVSLVWTLFIINVSQNVLGDSITGLGFQIAFYYGLTGFACAIYYRRELFRSAKNFFMVGGGAVPRRADADLHIRQGVHRQRPGGLRVLRRRVRARRARTRSASGCSLVGVVLMVFANFVYPRFFRRKPETAPPHFLERGRGGGPRSTRSRPNEERTLDVRDRRRLRRQRRRQGGSRPSRSPWPRNLATRS